MEIASFKGRGALKMDLEIIKNGSKKEEKKDRQLEVMDAEMTLQNASLAHEYARLELDNVRCSFEQLKLSEKLDAYKNAYYDARKYLEVYRPDRLEILEEQLLLQKKELFTYYSA